MRREANAIAERRIVVVVVSKRECGVKERRRVGESRSGDED